jgi:hypothetical protein
LIFYSLGRFTADNQVKNLMGSFFSTYFSAAPLAILMAFVFVPAHKRVVFMAGFDLIVSLFVQTVIRMFASWAVKTDLAQAAFRNMTESADISRRNTERLRRLGDEL